MRYTIYILLIPFLFISNITYSQKTITGNFYINRTYPAVLDNEIIYFEGKQGIQAYLLNEEKIQNLSCNTQSSRSRLLENKKFSVHNGYYFCEEENNFILKKFPEQTEIINAKLSKTSDWTGGAFVGISKNNPNETIVHYFDENYNEILQLDHNDYSKISGTNLREVQDFFNLIGILPMINDFFPISEGLIKFYHPSTKKYGFISQEKEMVIEPKYNDASNFSEGLAFVQDDYGNWGAIDKNGKTIIDFNFSNKPFDFKNGLAKVQGKNWKFGFINLQGEVVIQPKYAYATSFYQDFALAMDDNNNLVLIDANGKVKTNFGKYLAYLYDDVTDHSATLESLMKHGKGVFKKGLSYGLLSVDGSTLIDFTFQMINDFNGKHALGHKSEFINGKAQHKYGLIDSSGKFILLIEKDQF